MWSHLPVCVCALRYTSDHPVRVHSCRRVMRVPALRHVSCARRAASAHATGCATAPHNACECARVHTCTYTVCTYTVHTRTRARAHTRAHTYVCACTCEYMHAEHEMLRAKERPRRMSRNRYDVARTTIDSRYRRTTLQLHTVTNVISRQCRNRRTPHMQ